MSTAPRPTLEKTTGTVSDILSGVNSVLDDLRGELEEWYENLHENFQNGSKGEELQEAISQLEGISEVEIPAVLEFLEEESVELVLPKLRSKPSKAARRDRETETLSQLIDYLEGRKDEFEGMVESAPDERAESTKETEGPVTKEEFEAVVDALITFIDEVTSFKDEAEEVQFPGAR